MISAIVFSIGYKMKGSLGIPFLVCAVYLLLKLNWKKSIPALLCFILVFTANLKIFTKSFNYLGIVNEERLYKSEFPFEHWVAMGLVEPGGFYAPDFEHTLSLENSKVKKEECAKLVKDRINDRLKKRTMYKHIKSKKDYIWSEADYHVSLQVYEYPLNPLRFGLENYNRLVHPNSKIYNLFKKGKMENDFFITYTKCFHLTFFIMMFIGAIKRILIPKVDERLIYQEITLGIALFLLIWEARSRYLLLLTPVMLMLMFYGFDDLFQLLQNNWNKLKVRNSKQ